MELRIPNVNGKKKNKRSFFGDHSLTHCCFVEYDENRIHVYNVDFPTSLVSLSQANNTCACPIPSWQLDPFGCQLCSVTGRDGRKKNTEK